MALMLVCGALLLAGVALSLRWGREELVPPELLRPTAVGAARRLDGLRLYAWWASMLVVVGAVSGVLITGAGGRLAMRALALSSPESTNRVTEAGALIGRISTEGTIAYLVFGALPFAIASAGVYLLVAPWLPRGRAAGPALGVLLLVTVAPFVDPLRAENIDFDRLGPGWLSIVLFAALALLQGTALTAIGGRLSRALPLVSRRVPAAALPLLLAVVLVPVGAVLALGALVVGAAPRLLPWFLDLRASPGGVVVGRGLLALAVLVALPGCIGAVASIVAR